MGKCKPMEVSREEEWPERVSAKGEGTKEGVPRESQKRGENTEVKYKDQWILSLQLPNCVSLGKCFHL